MIDRLVGVPAHLHPQGPYQELLPKRRVVSADMVRRFHQFMAERERLLTPAHIAAVDQWLATQSATDPAIADARAPELDSYLRQVGASTMIERDRSGVARLTKAAFVMSTGDDPRDQTWRLLRFSAQAAASMTDTPRDMLLEIAADLGSRSVEILESRWQYIERIEALPLTRHQPSGLPLLEPRWDAEANAKRLGLTARLLGGQVSRYSLPWTVPTDPYVDSTAGLDEAAPDDVAPAYDFVEPLNRYLRTGADSDRSALLASLDSDEAERWSAWAARYWHGERRPVELPQLDDLVPAESSAEPGGLVAVNRAGIAQVSWLLG